MKRREFSRAAKVAMVKRAMKDGCACCELCAAPMKTGRWEYHHTVEEELVIDKTKPLTADDGLLVCRECHKDVTATQSLPRVAKAKRREAARLGVRKTPAAKIKSRGFAKVVRDRSALPVANGVSEIARRFGK